MFKLPRNAQLWGPGYVRSSFTRFGRTFRDGEPLTVWIAIADHYEPYWRNTDDDVARARVTAWTRHWPQIAGRHTDSVGNSAKYTFFYPQEEYRPWLLDSLAAMVHQGIADVDVHIHHDGEGEADFIGRMSGFIDVLRRRHDLLRVVNDKTVFGFIHGNWALDNSRPDGQRCGLNNEITLLKQLGCYADFTMPSGASPTQARTVNIIYQAVDDPAQPRSYDFGVAVTPGGGQAGDLLMIPGPFGLRWRGRAMPRLETGELAHQDLPTRYRVCRWLDLAPRIGGNVFIKLYTHGAQERNLQPLLEGGALDRLYELLTVECAERGHKLRFCSTWEMYQAVAEAGSLRLPW